MQHFLFILNQMSQYSSVNLKVEVSFHPIKNNPDIWKKNFIEC